MQEWDTLARYERTGFDIVVERSWEFIHPRDMFDDSCYDIEAMCDKIDRGVLDWFMLRVRVLLEGLELGSAYLGGCLYEDASEVLTDGTAEDLIEEALHGARTAVYPLMKKLQAINEEIEREGIEC